MEEFDKQFEFINSERDSIICARARSFIDFEPLLYKVCLGGHIVVKLLMNKHIQKVDFWYF